MSNRREFLRRVGGLSFLPSALAAVRAAGARVEGLSPQEAARDEAYWNEIRKAYTRPSDFINLEGGYFTPSAEPVLAAHVRNLRRVNEEGSFYYRRRYGGENAALKRQLAEFAGCAPEELAITRNTTEALATVIGGLKLAAGDEVLLGDREYPTVTAALRQKSRRQGITLKGVPVPRRPKDDAEIVRAFEAALSAKTRAMLVSHVVYLNGQVLPVRSLCEMARGKGVQVIVDAAHSFAHLDFKVRDLGCDYLGASLHKWLGAPLGTGLLYVAKERIREVWPLFGDGSPEDDIRKFENDGTQPVAARVSVAEAIRFHESIGSKRKEERLRYLMKYWVERAATIPKLSILTPQGEGQSCAIASFTVEGRKDDEVASLLYAKYRLFTVSLGGGVRVTPNLSTSIEDLDKLVAALKEIAA